MAAGNPSTIGTGTEVLRRYFGHAISNGTLQMDGVADHIYTLLSIVICENGAGGGAIETTSIYIDPDTGTDNIYLVNAHTIPAGETFVFSEKVVWTNTDKLFVYTSEGDCDVYITYIDQDFS
tara:strand:+ start:20 stop:385 length:366 start_codon:yes stop_codon:yes gene_type:complete